MKRSFRIINATQITSLDTMKPYSVKFGGRWFWIRSLEDVHRALDYRDKKERAKREKNQKR